MSLESMKKMREEIAIKLAEINKMAQDVFREEANKVFKKHPELVSFSWKQYTPYFMDGDPCVFSSYKDSPAVTVKHLNGEEVMADCYTSDYTGPEEDMPKFINDIVGSVIQLLSNFEDDDVEQMFGDHTEVIVTATEITNEEYDHD